MKSWTVIRGVKLNLWGWGKLPLHFKAWMLQYGCLAKCTHSCENEHSEPYFLLWCSSPYGTGKYVGWRACENSSGPLLCSQICWCCVLPALHPRRKPPSLQSTPVTRSGSAAGHILQWEWDRDKERQKQLVSKLDDLNLLYITVHMFGVSTLFIYFFMFLIFWKNLIPFKQGFTILIKTDIKGPHNVQKDVLLFWTSPHVIPSPQSTFFNIDKYSNDSEHCDIEDWNKDCYRIILSFNLY